MAFRFRAVPRAVRWLRKIVVGCALSGTLLTTTARVAPAQDVSTARRDVMAADDFRVRVTAALLLGRVRPLGAREALERALTDVHPAVRTAAAAALASVGDPAAVAALEHQLARESAQGAKAQMRTSIETLKHGHNIASRAKVVVVLGSMKNQTGVRGNELADVLATAAKSHARALSGVLLADSRESPLVQEAREQHVPVFLLDGTVADLKQSRDGANVQLRAAVEFVLRKDQDLKGRLSGAATAFGTATSLKNPKILHQLQDDAIDGAVQSAMRGANTGLTLAAK